jgi:hypothetical protein
MSLVSVSSSVLAQADTIPDDSGGPYVIAAYVVFLVLIAIYVAIMAQRLAKVSKAADELQLRLDRAAISAVAGEAAPSSGAGAVQGGSAVHGEDPAAGTQPVGSGSPEGASA